MDTIEVLNNLINKLEDMKVRPSDAFNNGYDNGISNSISLLKEEIEKVKLINGIKFVNQNYVQEENPYDLTASLLQDAFTFDLAYLIEINETIFGRDFYQNNILMGNTSEIVEESFYDYKDKN